MKRRSTEFLVLKDVLYQHSLDGVPLLDVSPTRDSSRIKAKITGSLMSQNQLAPPWFFEAVIAPPLKRPLELFLSNIVPLNGSRSM